MNLLDTQPAAQRPAGPAQEGPRGSFCLLFTGDGRYAIETRRIREVLGNCPVQRVPLAPPHLAGIVPYRGEVLTAVSFRALLSLPARSGPNSVLVLEDPNENETFALVVDSVGGVIEVDHLRLTPNPSTLDPERARLFDGSYSTPGGLTIRLDPAILRPSRRGEITREKIPCAH